jgi:8-oxo-dGTP pyrophosphatase MutT (NUDIX family)
MIANFSRSPKKRSARAAIRNQLNTLRSTWNEAVSPTEPLDRIKERLDGYRRKVLPQRKDLTPAAVALPLLYGEDGTLDVLFTVRTDRVEHHKGEISFPGGRRDQGDADALATALRETREEIGIPQEAFRLLGALDDFVSISGYLVTPFVVLCDRPAVFYPEPAEVAEILTIPLPHLLDPANHFADLAARTDRIHSYSWNGKEIWGLTGGILHHFLELTFDFPAS